MERRSTAPGVRSRAKREGRARASLGLVRMGGGKPAQLYCLEGWGGGVASCGVLGIGRGCENATPPPPGQEKDSSNLKMFGRNRVKLDIDNLSINSQSIYQMSEMIKKLFVTL